MVRGRSGRWSAALLAFVAACACGCSRDDAPAPGETAPTGEVAAGAERPNDEPEAFPKSLSHLRRTKHTRLIDVWGRPIEHANQVSAVAFSPDGKLGASGDWNGTIKVWTVPAFTPVETFQEGAAVETVAFLPDGKRIVSNCGVSFVSFWDVTTGERLRRIGKSNVRKFRDAWARVPLALTPDGTSAVMGTRDNRVQAIDLATGEVFQEFTGHTGAIASLAVSPDGATVLSGSDDNTARLWVLNTGEELQRLSVRYDHAVVSVAFLPNANRALTAGASGGFRVWDLRTGKIVRTLRPAPENDYTHLGSVDVVAVSRDGRTAFGGLFNALQWFDLATGKVTHEVIFHRKVISLALSPDGKLLLAGTAHGRIVCLEAQSGKTVYGTLPERTHAHTGRVTALAVSADGKLVMSGASDETVKFWDVATGRPAKCATAYPHCEDDFTINSVSLSPDRRYALWALSQDHHMVVGVSKTTLVQWDLADNAPEGHGAPMDVDCHATAFSPDGKLAAAGHARQATWTIAPGKEQEVETEMAAATAGITIWNVKSGKVVRTLKGHDQTTVFVAFLPKNRMLSAGQLGRLALWDLATGEAILSWSTGQEDTDSVGVTPDGKRALTGHSFGVLQLWDVEKGKLIRQLDKEPSHVRVIAVSPDGRFALTGGHWGMNLWDLGALRRIDHLDVPGVFSAAFAPDGKSFFVGIDAMILRFVLLR